MVDDVDKQSLIAALLAEPVLARLATANRKTCQPHVVPVWFWWDGESVWISSFTSTRKVKELRGNSLCALLVEPSHPEGVLQAVLLEGEALLISEPRAFVEQMAERIYTHYLGPEGVMAPAPQSWIRDPENVLVRLTPRRTLSW